MWDTITKIIELEGDLFPVVLEAGGPEEPVVRKLGG